MHRAKSSWIFGGLGLEPAWGKMKLTRPSPRMSAHQGESLDSLALCFRHPGNAPPIPPHQAPNSSNPNPPLPPNPGQRLVDLNVLAKLADLSGRQFCT